MNVLIIGGTGVLSGAVSRQAIKQGYKVSILHRGTKPHLIPDGCESLIADAHDRVAVSRLLQGLTFDAVIDFICYNKQQLSNSFDTFAQYARQYIFISTACVYDTSLRGGVKDENAPKVLKDWAYSKEKWESELFLMDAAKNAGIPYTIVRPAVTYDDTRIPYGITPVYGYHWTLIGRILANKPIITWDNGSARWSLIRVEDFAVGVVGVIGNQKAYNEAYNISSDVSYSWDDVLETLSKVLDKPVLKYNLSAQEYGKLYPSRAGEITARSFDLIADNSKIKQIVPSFCTSITLEEGLRSVVDGYRKNKYYYGIDYKFDAEQDRIINAGSGTKYGFVDYLGDATLKQKVLYYSVLDSSNLRGLVFRYLLKIMGKWDKITRL